MAPPAGARRAQQKIVSLYVPEKAKKTQLIAGSPAEAAKELVRALRDEARVICDDSRHRRAARRQAESRDVGNDRRRAAARGRRSRSPIARAWCRRHGRRWPRELAAAAVARGRHARARRRSSRTRRTATPRRCRPRSTQLAPAHRRCCRTPTRRATSRRSSRRGWTARSSPTSPASSAAAARSRFVRPMFQGKLTADVVPQGPAPHFVTFQIGAFRADQAAQGRVAGAGAGARRDRRRRRDPPEAGGAVPGGASRPSTCRRPSASSSVGRGIKEQANIAAGAAAGRGARRRARRVAADLRRRLAADGAAGRQLRARRSRRSCTSRSASPARFSTSSA